MAFFALHEPVLSFKREIGSVVIKICLIYPIPSSGVVAGGAYFSELVIVRIAMTVNTLCELGLLKSQEWLVIWEPIVNDTWMAFFTRNLNVLSGQMKSRFVVIEFWSGLPATHNVTVQAVFCHLPAMFVMVTAETIGVQTQKSGLDILLPLLEQIYVGNIGGPMAGTTLLLGVFSFKRVTGFGMIKTLLAVLPIDQIKVASMMLYMTLLTLLIRWTRVKSFILVNLISENNMAGETFGGSYLLAGIMTLGAVG
jgi:hypothetical protein